MSFGKDRRLLNANFAQQARRSMSRPKKESKGGLHFINNYKPPTTGSDIIRLIPGQFQIPLVDREAGDYAKDENGSVMTETYPYFPYSEHYSGSRQKSSFCSAGPLSSIKGKADRCIGCEWFWGEWAIRQESGEKVPKSMSKRDMWAFTVLVMAPFHKTEDLDESGQVKINQNTKQPYFNWRKCLGRGCSMCAAGKETKQGHTQHWSMGKAHFTTLLEYSHIIGKNCRSCGTQGSVEDMAWLCQNEECGDAVIDMNTTTLTDEEIGAMVNDIAVCPSCRMQTYLKCAYACKQCGDNNSRTTIFDVDMEVKRVEDPSGDSHQTSLVIVRFSSAKPIDGIYGEDARKSLPLDKIFAPTALDRQLASFGTAPTLGE